MRLGAGARFLQQEASRQRSKPINQEMQHKHLIHGDQYRKQQLKDVREAALGSGRGGLERG